MQLTLGQTMFIYQCAIDKTAGAGEGDAWRSEVQAEVEAVIAAPTTAAAAEVIAWWHCIWKDVNDTPVRAAGRIRTQAARLLRNSRKSVTRARQPTESWHNEARQNGKHSSTDTAHRSTSPWSRTKGPRRCTVFSCPWPGR